MEAEGDTFLQILDNLRCRIQDLRDKEADLVRQLDHAKKRVKYEQTREEVNGMNGNTEKNQ